VTGSKDQLPVTPVPNWPLELFPQHSIVPPAIRAHVWTDPAAMAVADGSEKTITGVGQVVTRGSPFVPTGGSLPSSPKLLCPQHLAVPVVARRTCAGRWH